MQPVREVYSLLMPVHGGRVILPRAAIAEVTGYTRPKDRPEDAPEFVLGFIEWQGQKVPLVSFEAARGQPVPELGRRTRIAVLFGIAEKLNPNVFAVVTQGYPYLVRVNENVLQREALEEDEPLVLARVRMANEKPYIPDIEKLELMIAEGLGVQEAVAEDLAEPEEVDELEALDSGEEDDFAGMLVDEDALDTANEAVEPDDSDTGDNAETTLSGAATDVNLDEVTAFGAETDYSAELGELSSALEDDAAESTDSDDDLAVDLSGFDVEDDNETSSGEIDFSDIEIDFDDDDEKSGA